MLAGISSTSCTDVTDVSHGLALLVGAGEVKVQESEHPSATMSSLCLKTQLWKRWCSTLHYAGSGRKSRTVTAASEKRLQNHLFDARQHIPRLPAAVLAVPAKVGQMFGAESTHLPQSHRSLN